MSTRASLHFVLPAIGLALLSVSAPASDAAKKKSSKDGRDKNAETVHFANDIVPILSKYSCNTGGCHGRFNGQNGFKLSLFGYEPLEDYEHIVKEARGRRVSPAAPEQSLLLLKGTNTVPHTGGKRLDPESKDYALIVKWIRQGMPEQSLNPALTAIEVEPRETVLKKGATKQLKVIATYSDGTRRDVTRTAIYDPVDKAMATVSSEGLVSLTDIPGDAAVMVRYQGQVTVFRATVPMGKALNKLPAAQNFVDEHVFRKLKILGLPPSPLCEDGPFLRRLSLDIAGRLPTLEETRAFLADSSPDKRDRAIDRLLDSMDYAEFFAGKWSGLLRNKRVEATYERGCVLFWQWIRDSLLANKPYNEFVREILTASGDIEHSPPVAWYRSFKEPHVQMEDVAQLFLGTRMQCAQCHHHPYEKWSQHDYLALSAFFSQIARKPSGIIGEDIVVRKRGDAQILNKKTKEQVKPAALGEKPAPLTANDDPRQALAAWMVADENPYFARTLVNRYWKHFFGRGIVEAEDDIRDTNPPSNPELLDALTKDFIASKYDLKKLIRTITRSRTYQLSSTPNEYNVADRQNFSRYYPKRLMAEVLFDAVNTSLKSDTNFKNLAVNTRAVALPDNSFNANSYFLTVFGRPESSSACECERTMEASLAQSLHLLNADEIQQKLGNSRGRAAALSADARSDEEKLKEIYLLALSREPSSDELAQMQGHIAAKIAKVTAPPAPPAPPLQGPPAPAPDKKKIAEDINKARRQAWEDILWALINTKEFLFNH
ncbi:MAG TPA: DUF1549 and DUF1553 domain-containing protein [Planctomycetota bacterium]|nr:DUF1549 and DUF1553 domain-containing protein [Planctomycetota bacterium]